VTEAKLSLPIFLDNNSTTPVDPRVLSAMSATFSEHFGNPASSTHSHGWYAEELVQIARENVGELLNADPAEIIFTSGATEANNLALLGALRYLSSKNLSGRALHVITAATEHLSVLDPLKHELEQGRIELTILPVSNDGVVSPDSLDAAIRPSTALVSLMLVNNEIGTIQDLTALSKVIRKYKAIFHCDAVQAIGKIGVDCQTLDVDLLSLSPHKFHGPKGVGALFIRQGVVIEPLHFGGGHERNLRPGTQNVPGIVGLAAAAKIAQREFSANIGRVKQLTALLLNSLSKALPNVVLNGSSTSRVSGNLNLCFPGVSNAALIGALASKLSCSATSACTSLKKSPSHVLAAIGLTEEQQLSSIRIGIGTQNTVEEIEAAADIIISAVRTLQR